ncbi:MAG TPA: erythromycin esterase family protein [Gemmatimonadales bacterium]
MPPIPLTGSRSDHDALLELVGDRSLVLLGEASHGTHEFYAERARITRRLIEERGFTAVAVEADWPDAYRVNRWVRGHGDDDSADEALGGFRRFPTWMWRNTDVRSLARWLRQHNAGVGDETERAGFYGIDLYSLHTSIDAVLGYLDQVDPEAAHRARYRYGCFEHFGEDVQAYGYAASFDLTQACEDEVVRQLVEMRQRAAEYAGQGDDGRAADEFFHAEQNARLVINAERYYRAMFRSSVGSWNLRDTHMADTLDALCTHLSERRGSPAKVVVWAHNSHLGDARFTELGRRGELNVGQLMRQRHDDDVVLVGFTTHAGTVTAASEWDEPPERKRVLPSLAGSHERELHEISEAMGAPRLFLDLRDDAGLAARFGVERLERAIGVIYRPETERLSHYFGAVLSEQFDALFHFDETRAVQPLDPPQRWPSVEVPETFPAGI